MGVIINSDDFLIDQVLDIVLIFVMGMIILFFFGTLINFPKTFIVSYALYIAFLLMFILVYINRYCENKTEHKNKLNVLNFMGIYTICLNTLMVVVTRYI